MVSRPNAIEKAAIEHVTANHLCYARGLRVAIEAKFPGAIERSRAAREKRKHDALFTGKPPAWAIRFMDKYAPGTPLIWRRSRVKTGTSGSCEYYGRIAVTVGRGAGSLTGDGLTVTWTHDEDEDRSVLLHEIAHHLTPHHHHDDRFYDEWCRLLVAERLYRKSLTLHRSTANSLRRAYSRARAKRARAAA